MSDRLSHVFAEKGPHPSHPFARHNMVGVDVVPQFAKVGNVAPDDDRRVRLMLANEAAHPADLEQVRHDRGYSNHVVLTRCNFLNESLLRRKVEQRARGVDIRLNEHQSPGTMKCTQREGALHAGHLVLVQFHRVDPPTAARVVFSVGSKDADEQHPRL